MGMAYLYIEMYKAKKLRAPCKYSMGCDYTDGRLRPQTMFIFYGGKNQLLDLQEKQELKLVCKCVSEDQRGLI